MTMKAFIQRDMATGKDAYRNPLPPNYQPQFEESCYAWSESRVEAIDVNKDARVETVRVLFPLATTVLEEDRVAKVTDALGRTVFEGPYRVRSLRKREAHQVGMRVSHCEASLELLTK